MKKKNKKRKIQKEERTSVPRPLSWNIYDLNPGCFAPESELIRPT
jgi:hypothetical protein